MILAIDLGSTSFKAAILDARLRVKGFSGCEVQHRFASGGVVELDVAEAEHALRKAIRGAVKAASLRPAKLQALAVTSQAQTFTVIDHRGQPRMPFISWQDNRAVRACEQLKKNRTMREFGRHCSFGSLVAPLMICQLRHLRNTRPDFFREKDTVVCLPTFFVRRCCGVAAADENLAAMSGLYSLTMRGWWPAALSLCGLRSCHLPELRPLGGVAGHTSAAATEFGLPRNIPVILAGNDQTAGAYAARLDENRGLLATLGTALTAYTYSKTPPRPNAALLRGHFPRGGWYRMAADSCGGSVINWAETILCGCGTDEKFFKHAAHSPPGCRGLRFDSTCDQGRGRWSNIGFHHSSADFARSVLESLAGRMSELIRQLGVQVDQTPVLVAGGGSRNPLWVRILSQNLGVGVKVTDGRPFVGAARMAWRTLVGIRT